MNRLGRFRLAAVISVVALTLTALFLPGASSARTVAAASAAPAGSLNVSPESYVGGQLLTFFGNIGAKGVRKIHLQAHLGRGGDSWQRIPGSTAKTDANGDFNFQFRAPSMFNIKYRAASGKLTTDPMNFKALSQDLTVEVKDGQTPVAGRPFTLVVDTTPELARRPDTENLPVFPGRELTLQVRGANGLWQNTGQTTKADQNGMGEFPGVRVDQAGTVVYRVRQENWFENGDRIGWVSSFPTFVGVASSTAKPTATRSTTSRKGSSPGTTSKATTENADVKTATAAEVFGWRPALWDFAWVAGESLTSPPYRGKAKNKNSMWWLDASTGTGRAAKHNGGLELDSQRANIDSDADCLKNNLHDEAWECSSRGSQWVTLQNGARKFGRWEVRVRTKSSDTTRKDFRTLLELVPAKNPDCAGKTITMGNFAAHARKMKFGVKSMRASKKWQKVRKVGDIENVSLTVAVEVTKRHISWFVNGKVIGTVKRKAAVPRVPLTMRLTQQGRGQEEMNRTQAIFDWMRGFDLSRGKKVKGGAPLKRRPYRAGC